MGSVPVAHPSPQGHHARWSRRAALIGLSLLAALGLFLAVTGVFVWPGGARPSPIMTAGEVDDFERGSVTLFEERPFFLVRLEDGTFLALYDRSPHMKNEPLQWRPNFEFMGKAGWFRSPFHGETFAKDGTAVFGPAGRDMDRFSVIIEGGQVKVNTSQLILGGALPPSTGTPTPGIPPAAP